MSQTWSYTNTSHSQCMSLTCLILAYLTRPMHVPDTSYTSFRLNADAMSQTWSYIDSRNTCLTLAHNSPYVIA
ncbi:Uncharacterized protein F383_01336 [Gossypium arboreum]|uniref:Uncharacterized protein n=1 Tax=Gossypium arboreum TaxID=29729 RepID=A0A0B0PZ64_GOSAR|nr:Uncharacterized protein F383_01336 [Gossypium arboreum]